MMHKKAEAEWSQIAAAILVVIVIVVVVIIFATKTSETQKDLGRCGGLIGSDKLSGECVQKGTCSGRIVSAFGTDCEEGQECCLKEQ